MADGDVPLRDHLTALLQAHELRDVDRHDALLRVVDQIRVDVRDAATRTGQQISRDEYVAAHELLRTQEEASARRLSVLEGASGGRARLTALLFSLVAAAGAVVAIVANLAR